MGKESQDDPWSSFDAFIERMRDTTGDIDIKPWDFPLPPADENELKTPLDREPATPRSPNKRFNASTTSLHHEPTGTGRTSPSKSSLKSNTSVKRPVEPTTPESSTARSIKRLREALSPKRQRPRTPGQSPRVKTLPPPPLRAEDLDSIIKSLQHAHSQSGTALSALEQWKGKHEEDAKAHADLVHRLTELEGSKVRMEQILQTTQIELEAKRIALKRARVSVNEMESLKGRLSDAQETIVALRSQLEQVGEVARRSTENTDRQVFVLEQELDRVRHERVREVERLRTENDMFRKRAEESEFGQNALREGGARLQREVERRDREIEALRKGLARGGRV
ncbi:hypothetical protein BCR39DRAFT_545323 [Naematelia encephala]|uniref:Uncharacterized protein n=1 Tax=Naematelia encephala TaxID=71784 RepID=A0A1Y2AQU8_9TREE|nr:hypothetical protein BCR39DRAFT_545323 [Naematelia encephala]